MRIWKILATSDQRFKNISTTQKVASATENNKVVRQHLYSLNISIFKIKSALIAQK